MGGAASMNVGSRSTFLGPGGCGRLDRMADVDHQQRAELAEFLRAHREALTPEMVKLPRGRARRTPGLRREEVALLAGVSVTWYTWLEQGRRINASTDVLRAIGRALRLDDAGQDHLVSLARPIDAGGSAVATPDEVPSALRRLIDGFDPAPAYVLGPRWEFAAWNAAEARLYPRIERLGAAQRHLMWALFADPDVRQLIVDWDIHARQALAEFRAATIAVRHEPAMTALVDDLCRNSDEFRRWWPEHDVARFETRLRRFNHPRAGLLTFENQQLTPSEWPSLRVVVMLPVPGDDSAQRLAVRHHVA
jgi:transcriptional regulator with XRE-family HTH domain